MSLLNPVNYLDLVQRLHVEVGVTDSPPATVVGLQGQAMTLALYVNQSWRKIQLIHDDWMFMRVSPGTSFPTVAGQMRYTIVQAGIAAGAVNSWARNTFRVYLTSAGLPSEIRMNLWDYDEWRDAFEISSLRTAQTQPVDLAIAPDLSLCLACPLVGYTVTGDYYSSPIGLENDSDVPTIPNQFIMAIVYDAMMTYAQFESAPEVYAQGKSGYDVLINKLEHSRLAQIRTAGALA